MMTRIMNHRMRDEDRGFTLIELMVVVLIIAILIAIAIPTFLGARERAQNRAAQSSLRNALTAAKTIFTDNEDYQEADVSALQAAEPSLDFVADPANSDDPNQISIYSVLADEWAAAALSNSGTCFYIKDTLSAGGPGTEYGSLDEGDDACAGSDADTAASNPSW